MAEFLEKLDESHANKKKGRGEEEKKRDMMTKERAGPAELEGRAGGAPLLSNAGRQQSNRKGEGRKVT